MTIELAHKIPESLRAFCRIVSLTAAKTSRMFDVSVACVRLQQLALISNASTRHTEGIGSDALC